MKLTIEQKQFLKRNNLTLKQVGDFFGIVNINKSRKSKHKYVNALMAFENHIKEMEIKKINEAITKLKDTNNVSDGYHTFGELYEHRVKLFIALCKARKDLNPIRSFVNSEGVKYDDWFLLQIGSYGSQIRYHLPKSEWENCSFAKEVEQMPEFDGHTAKDVVTRIAEL